MPQERSGGRRRSISVVEGDQPRPKPRRAHSIAPSRVQSRPSLQPLKGILKAAANLFGRESLEPGLSSQSSSQQSQPSQQSIQADESDVTQSMDMTRDFTARIHDNHARKSMNRRVSFSEAAQVRLFTKANNNTASTASAGSPPSSPGSPSQDFMPPDENNYPGASSSKQQRRSSVRMSVASEDFNLSDVIAGLDDSAIDEDGDDMEMTMIRGAPSRKQSVAFAASPDKSAEDMDMETSQMSLDEEPEVSQDNAAGDYTVPLEQALSPAQEDPAWMALRDATHSGNEPTSTDVELAETLARMERARASMSIVNDSMSMSDLSGSEKSLSDQTLNLTNILGRTSMAPTEGRMSMGFLSNMDESELYDRNLAHSTPRPSFAPTFAPSPSDSAPFDPSPERPSEAPSNPRPVTNSVFRAPPSNAARPAGRQSLAPTPSSPTKGRPRSFSAAFAPPVVMPSPKRPASTISAETVEASGSTPSTSSPAKKRPRPSTLPTQQNADEDQPSPAKRPTPATQWDNTASTSETGPQQTSKAAQRKSFLPTRKAPFQAFNDANVSRPASLLRQNISNRRMSMGASASAQQPAVDSQPKQNSGAGRMSMGAGAGDAWKRFEKPTPSAIYPQLPSQPQNVEEDVPMEEDEEPAVSQKPAVDLSTIFEPEGTAEEEEENNQRRMDLGAQNTERWREGVEPDAEPEEDLPPVSIEQFMELTNIKFMDELSAPRRSMLPPKTLHHQPRNPADIKLAECAIAVGVDAPQLLLYSRVSSDLQGWMEKSLHVFKQAEEEAEKVTPELFVEYVRADEQGQKDLMGHLRLIKNNARYSAKEDWYNWRQTWTEGLITIADTAYSKLEEDMNTLEKLKAQHANLEQDLETEYASLMEELRLEEKEVEDIEGCDQDYLNELKVSIAEQEIEVESLQTEAAECQKQTAWFKERIEETEQKEREFSDAIADMSRGLDIQQNSTRSEVLRLQSELETLEELHRFRLSKISDSTLTFVYDSKYSITIPCRDYQPVVQRLDLEVLSSAKGRAKDVLPKFTSCIPPIAMQWLRSSNAKTCAEIVQQNSAFWSGVSQLRTQLYFLAVKYPVGILALPESSGFKAQVPVLFEAQRAKVIISFIFDTRTIATWPVSIQSTKYEVDVAYGDVDQNKIYEAVKARLADVEPSNAYACLLDVCIEAQEQYNTAM